MLKRLKPMCIAARITHKTPGNSFVVAVHMGFKCFLLRNTLKPMCIAAKTSPVTSKIDQKCLKPMRIAAKITRRAARSRRRTCNSKAQREGEPRPSRTRAASPRPLARHARHARTKRKRRRNEADLPVAGGRTSRTSSP